MRAGLHSRFLASILCAVAAMPALIAAPCVQAQEIHTCIGARGAVAYQNAPCPPGYVTRAIRHYRVAAIDPALAARSHAIEQEMDRRNRVDRRAARAVVVRSGPARVDPCRAAKQKRDATLKRVGLKRDYDLLSRLDNDVWDVCKGF